MKTGVADQAGQRRRRRGGRRRTLTAAGVATAFAALALASPTMAHTTQGNAIPPNDGAHPWPTDGCSTPGVRVDSVRGVFNFRHACVHHDGCYTGFPRNGRPTYWTSRQQCDSWFLEDMRASCRWQHSQYSPVRGTCMDWAWRYYLAVRAFGRGGYKGPQNN